MPEKLVTTCTEDGHKQNNKTALKYKPKDEGTQEVLGRDGGTKFTVRIKEQETHLTLHEHDDDDDDDDECWMFNGKDQVLCNVKLFNDQ